MGMVTFSYLWLRNPWTDFDKTWIFNYVADMTTHANPCGAATTWVTCHIFPVFFYFMLGIKPSWTDFVHLYVVWRVSAQESAFWDHVDTALHFGVKSPGMNPRFVFLGCSWFRLINMQLPKARTPLGTGACSG